MAERPILFSEPMVQAILAGRKTQTRRVVQPSTENVYRLYGGEWAGLHPGGPGQTRYTVGLRCPYGEPGDMLWVRETWALLGPDYRPARRSVSIHDEGVRELARIAYRADHVDPLGDGPAHPMPWRPSIHMPRWASRLTLRVTSVRVERVQDITDDDILAEGLGWAETQGHAVATESPYHEYASPRDMWAALWDSINGKRPGCSWDANPWVWVVGFERVGVAPEVTP